MPRPLTKRSLEVVNVQAPQLEGYPKAFARLLETRNAGTVPRVYVRDLHEEAISELLREIEQGHQIRFLATPAARYLRRTIWIDQHLKARAAEVAAAHNVRIGSFVFTAFARYLEKQGLLQAA